MNSKVTGRFIACYEYISEQGMVPSARQFALALDFYPQSWNEILKGRRDVPLGLLEKAIHHYSFNPVYLYKGEGMYLLDDNNDGSLRIHNVVTNNQGRENIVHIPRKAQAGYAVNGAPLDKMQSMLSFTLPGLDHRFGSFRSFEVEGESMAPSILPGEIVVCRFVQPNLWNKLIEDNQVYVIVSNEDLVIKRIKNRLNNKNAMLHLNSDNPKFEPYMMAKKDVRELWFVEKLIKTFDQRNKTPEPNPSTSDLLELVRIQDGFIQDLKSQHQ